MSIVGGSVLGIDLGTQSVKVAAVDRSGTVVASASRAYAVEAPQPGWAESDPDAWLSSTLDAAREVLDRLPERPLAVGMSGQMHGVVLCDAAGHALRPAITWADGRSTEQAARLYVELGPRECARLGSAPFPGFAGPTLAWLAERGELAAARWALQCKDWVRLRLTGEVATDPSDASGTLLYDVVAGRWSPTAIAACGIDTAQLPPIVGSSALGGVATGGPLSGLPIAVGGADAAAGIRGLGLQQGQGAISVGTGSQVTSILGDPHPDDTLRTHTFALTGDVGAGWYRLGAVQSGGLAFERALAWLAADTAEAQAALAHGVQADDPLFLPFVAGERSPYLDPSLRASWHGLGLGTTRAALLRSVLEGMAYAVSAAFDAVRESGAAPAEPVTLLGGGSRDPAYAQLLADALGIALQPAEVGDATVVGAARLAAPLVGIDIPPVGRSAGAVVTPGGNALVSERQRRWRARVDAQLRD